jgi:hypothetical protein
MSLPGLFEPKLFGGILHRAESVKYLGVILDFGPVGGPVAGCGA